MTVLPGLGDLLLAISVVFALVTIYFKLSLIRHGHRPHNDMRWWVIAVCVYVIGSRLIILLSEIEHNGPGVTVSEPIVIALLGLELYHASIER